jgi:hypothetical protein
MVSSLLISMRSHEWKERAQLVESCIVVRVGLRIPKEVLRKARDISSTEESSGEAVA